MLYKAVVFIRRYCVVALILALALSVSGCSTVQFYSQSIIGHSRLMLARIPIDKAIAQAGSAQRDMLNKVGPILEFAENDIGLPVNGSYSSFVPLVRDYPVYVVSAAPEFSLQAKQWCYLVIGCASYRGYFSEEAAQQYAQALHKNESFEVYVRGANAYSTLGWFNDPILPSMLNFGEVYLAEVLLHELTHQKLYLNGDTDFNEALASAVAQIATVRWLVQQSGESNTAGVLDSRVAEYQKALEMRDDFDQLIAKHKADLQTLYASAALDNISPSQLVELRAGKQKLQQELLREYARLKSSKWHSDTRYDSWFAEPVNNARLSAMSSYRDQIGAFESLYFACDQDFSRFFATLKAQSQSSALGPVLNTDGGIIPAECL